MLDANWVFRVATLDRAPEYLKAVRRSFLLLGMAPLWSGVAALLLLTLPWRAAAAHLALLAILAVMLTDLCMGRFGKIPFTCSYQPGKGNLQFALWGALALLPLSLLGARYEWARVQSLRGELTVALLPVLPAIGLHWWTDRRVRAASELLFEDAEEPAIVSLALAVDAGVQAGVQGT